MKQRFWYLVGKEQAGEHDTRRQKYLLDPREKIFRSATVAAAYLVQYSDMGLATALTQIRQHRDVRPNNGFIVQLIKLEHAQ